jgi:hypothetical protein
MGPSCKFSEEFLQCPRILSGGFIQRPKLARLARIDQPCFVPERIRFQTAFLIPIYLTSNIPIDHRIDNRSIFFNLCHICPMWWWSHLIEKSHIHIYTSYIYICTCMHIHNYTTHIYMYILYIYIFVCIFTYLHMLCTVYHIWRPQVA